MYFNKTNVFFLIEVVRALSEQAGALTGVTALSEAALPAGLLTGGILRIAERRAAGVAAALREPLELAATLGRELDLAVLERARPGVDWAAWLLSCSGAAVIERRASEWHFCHDKLREAILSGVPDARRRALHADAAQALESLYGTAPAKAATIAFHHARAGAWERAHHFYLQAGAGALHAASVAAARAHYQKAYEALAQLPEAERGTDAVNRKLVDTLLSQVQASLLSESAERNLARMAEAQARIEGLLARPEPARADRFRYARVQNLTGQVHYFGGQLAQAIACYRRVMPLAQEFGDEELLAMPARLLGTALGVQGHPRRSVALLELSLAPLLRAGDEAEWVQAMAFYGTNNVAIGNVAHGLRCIGQALGKARALGRPSLLAMALLTESCAALFRGHFAGMLVPAREALEHAAQVDDRMHLHIAWSYIAIAQSSVGEHEAAAQSRARARACAAPLGERRLLDEWFDAADAYMAALAGRYEEALERAAQTIEQARAGGYPYPLGIAERAGGIAHATRAETLEGDARQSALRDSDERMRASIGIFENSGYVLEVAQTRLRWADLLDRRGEEEAARALHAQAVATYRSCGCVEAIEGAQPLGER